MPHMTILKLSYASCVGLISQEIVQKRLKWQTLSHILSVSCSAWPMTIMISLLSLSPCYFPFSHYSRSATFCEKRWLLLRSSPWLRDADELHRDLKLHARKFCVWSVRRNESEFKFFHSRCWILDCKPHCSDPCKSKCVYMHTRFCFLRRGSNHHNN